MSKLIAIIDDEPEMGFVYSMVLEKWISEGCIQLHFFSDSRLFLEWLKEHKPSLVLTDINMPHISGTELAQLIKIKDCNIPVYFVSGDPDIEYRPLMKALRIEGFLNKPINFKELLGLIELELGLVVANH